MKAILIATAVVFVATALPVASAQAWNDCNGNADIDCWDWNLKYCKVYVSATGRPGAVGNACIYDPSGNIPSLSGRTLEEVYCALFGFLFTGGPCD